jgi:hypothetical protein
MKDMGIMDARIECVGLPTLPADPMSAHLNHSGAFGLPMD